MTLEIVRTSASPKIDGSKFGDAAAIGDGDDLFANRQRTVVAIRVAQIEHRHRVCCEVDCRETPASVRMHAHERGRAILRDAWTIERVFVAAGDQYADAAVAQSNADEIAPSAAAARGNRGLAVRAGDRFAKRRVASDATDAAAIRIPDLEI